MTHSLAAQQIQAARRHLNGLPQDATATWNRFLRVFGSAELAERPPRSQRRCVSMSWAGRQAHKEEDFRRRDATWSDFRLFAGSEVDILRDGSLDFDDSILAQLDYVVASARPKRSAES